MSFRILKAVAKTSAVVGVVGGSSYFLFQIPFQGKSPQQAIADAGLTYSRLRLRAANAQYWMTEGKPFPSPEAVSLDSLMRAAVKVTPAEVLEKCGTVYASLMQHRSDLKHGYSFLLAPTPKYTNVRDVQVGGIPATMVRWPRVCFARNDKLHDGIAVNPVSAFGSGSSDDDGLPQGPDSPVFVFLHGGGYFCGSPRNSINMCSHIARRTGVTCLALKYRLIPENDFPAPVDDVMNAVQWLIEERNIDPKNIILSGDSAGGGLAALALQRMARENRPMPAGGILISPWMQLFNKGPSLVTNTTRDALLHPDCLDPDVSMFVEAVFGGKTADEVPAADRHLYSPNHGSFKGLPPLYFIVGETEIMRSESLEGALKAKNERVDVTLEVVPHMMHSFPILVDQIPEANEAVERFSQFIINHCKSVKDPNCLD